MLLSHKGYICQNFELPNQNVLKRRVKGSKINSKSNNRVLLKANSIAIICIGILLNLLIPFHLYADNNSIGSWGDTITVSVEDICTGSPPVIDLEGLEPGLRYYITYEIYGVNPSTTRTVSLTAVDSIQSRILGNETATNPGIDTLHIISINDSLTIINDTLIYEVIQKPVISAQPQSIEICSGEVFSMSVASDISYDYQWEIKLPGYVNWLKVNATMPQIPTVEFNGENSWQLNVDDKDSENIHVDESWFRVKVTNGICTTYSDSAQMVVDTTKPILLVYPPDTVFIIEDSSCAVEYDFMKYRTLSNFYDTCGIQTYYHQRKIDGRDVPDKNSHFFEVGVTTITFIVFDNNENELSYPFTVEVVGSVPTIECPPVVHAYADSSCFAIANFPDTIVKVGPCLPYSLDDLDYITPGYVSGDYFPVGTTTLDRYLLHEDDTVAFCSFDVLVHDTVAPSIVCPPDSIFNIDPGKLVATVDYEEPFLKDCSPRPKLIFPDDDLLPGEEFPLGNTTIVWGAEDANGYKSFCDFTITVVDDEQPIIECPYNNEIFLRPAQCDTSLVFKFPSASDNDSSNTVTITHTLDSTIGGNKAYGIFHPGDSSIIWTATDVHGNNSTCVHNIKIVQSNVAIDDSFTAYKNQSTQLQPFQNDLYCSRYLTLSKIKIITGPRNGTYSILDDLDLISYTPEIGFEGKDSIQYVFCDTKGVCDTAWSYINVVVEYIPLQLKSDSLWSVNGSEVQSNILENDQFSKDGDYQLTQLTSPDFYSLTLDSLGNLWGQPNNGFYGMDSFQYQICDVWGDCMSATVYLFSEHDTDQDGIADPFDADADNDGIPDAVEKGMDTDMDGLTDNLDIDADGDGIVDFLEAQLQGEIRYPIGRDDNLNGWDAAFDYMEGGTELSYIDTDNDLVFDFQDVDSDGDNAPDLVEGNDGNSDGIVDISPFGVDSDGDGLDNAFDTEEGFSSPDNMAGTNVLLQDTDSDGVSDWRDDDDDDDSIPTLNEDADNSGVPMDDDTDLDGVPDYLDNIQYCEIVVPDGFSPNGDGIADYFYIRCIHLYPNAKLIVYNRWGQKVYELEHYGNTDIWGPRKAFWDGSTNMGLTVTSGKLSPSTYMYILDFGDGSEIRKGTIFLSRNADSMKF